MQAISATLVKRGGHDRHHASVSYRSERVDCAAVAGHQDPASAFASMYPELRSIAHARLRSRRDTLLDTTSLVNECYIRVFESGRDHTVAWPEFVRYASRVMRNIIVDAARRRSAQRRGGGVKDVEIEDEVASRGTGNEEEILSVALALEQLEKLDARLAQVVELRYFAGMTEVEIAGALGVTERTVRRDWNKARLLLAQAMS